MNWFKKHQIGLSWSGVVLVGLSGAMPIFGLYLDNILNTKPIFAIIFILLFILSFILGWFSIFVGAYYWAKRKNRHWVYTFWGLAVPIGYLGLALLQDKTKPNSTW